ncbi:MAG: nucleotidyltransferase family protein [Bdellovibrionales bacterium]|nr:nucleotidyltransferase family protein [Bdellovibrionales bacterium]
MNVRRPLSDEGRLVVLLTLLDPRPNERAEIARLFTAPIDYARFDRLARANVHRPWILTQMESLGHADRLPEPYAAEWRAEREKVRAKLERRFEVAEPLFERFDREGIPVALLKGTALSHRIYGNPYYKKSNDIDILVRPEDLPRVYAVYADLGFLPFGERVDKDRASQEKYAWHAAPYVSRDLSLVMGTQWGIKTLLGPYRVDYPKIWSRMDEIAFRKIPVKMLAPEDCLLHLCLHLGYFKTQLKDLVDVTNLLRYFRDRFDYDGFVADAIGARAASHAYHALALSQRLDPSDAVERMLVKLRPHAKAHYVTAVAKKTESMDDFLEMSVDWIQEIEIDMTLFMGARGLSKKWWAALRVWGTLLIPPRPAMLRMNFTLRAGILESLYYRAVTPFRILRALAEEIGWKLVGLLALKVVVDLAREFLALFRPPSGPKESPSPYAALARELGKSEDEIESFVREFN